jgi:transposase
VTTKLKRLYAQLRTLHSKVARQRKDLYHKLSGWLAEEFNMAAMTRRPEKKVDATTGASHTKQI